MSKKLMAIITTLVFIIVASIIGIWLNSKYISTIQTDVEDYQLLSLEYRSNLRLLENQINTFTISPTINLFDTAEATMIRISEIINSLKNGNNEVPKIPEGLSNNTENVYSAKDILQENYERLSNKDKITLLGFYSQLSIIRNIIPDFESILQDVVDRLSDDSNTPLSQILTLSKQIQSLKEIRILLHNIQEISGESNINSNKLSSLISITSNVQSIQESSELLLGIENESISDIPELKNQEIKELVQEFYDEWAGYSEFLLSIPETYNTVEDVVNATKIIKESINNAYNKSQLLSNDFIQIEHFYSKNTLMIYLLWFLIAISFILIVAILIITQRSNSINIAKRNQQIQNAILRLLDEIGGLADGDLTTEATVTEDFTGAIADSINLAIGQLRRLVGTINNTALQVTEAVQESISQAAELEKASKTQSQEITSASIAISNVASAIEKVSNSASESSMVAESSVSIANKGNQIVHNTIIGMNNIREQIQDTSKRIKRLGESSQEIGDIVGLINDIADQTNILALNAAIQASMAGDAGHGFAVVADEVQRLAERSANATKQIETLVKAIQNDTSEAVISMEQTTAEVVRGANLAQDAGISLEEIEKVSQNLAKLIQNISKKAQQQSSSAAYINSSMDIIQDITTKTTEGTQKTSKQILELMNLVEELRESVSGFDLVKKD